MPDPLDSLEERFAAALARPPAEREAFVRNSCAGDPVLAAELTALLQAHERSEKFLEDVPAHEVAAAARRDEARKAADEVAGARIGRYRLIEKIGEGGCGVVYRAEQEAPVQRPVALKIIKLGMDTRAFVARFEAERQALALMDHPNIARVFDAGETERGRPFFVMELVDGVPITRFCDEQRLSLVDRLELFIKVCQAIQHAHQKGVIHRDIKPSNVLVVRQDGEAVPKIIDFGIAKATESRLTERTLVTEFAQLIGTPAYMSPEQLDFARADIDTRSDVYALGVMLYELLTGSTPFANAELLRGGFDAMRRTIREQEPPRPSAAVGGLDATTLGAIALARRLEPARLAARLRGELDWIVMRCLEKDRARRYPTASALGDDVRHHLLHEPVTAAAPGGFYMFKKFARRHRAAFASGLAFAILLVVAAGVSAWLAARATRAEHLAQAHLRAEADARAMAERESARAQVAEKKARDEAARATAINDFLQNDILLQAAPGNQPDRNLTVRAAVDAAARRVEWKFVDQPMVALALRETLALTYLRLGEYESAAIHFDYAIALSRQHRGPEHLGTLNLLAQRVDLLRLQGKTAEAEKHARELLDVLRRVRGPEADETVSLMHQIAALLLEEGRAAEAEPLMLSVVAAHQRSRGAEDALTLNARNTLANVLFELGRDEEAEALHRQLFQIRLRQGGPENLDATYSMSGIASVLRRLGRFNEAIDLQRRVVEIRRRMQGDEHPDTLGAENNLALTLSDSGRSAEAVSLAATVLAARRRTLGTEHPGSLVTANVLAVIYLRLDRLSEAEEAAVPAYESALRVWGPAHPNTLLLGGVLADVWLEEKKFSAAEKLLRDLVARRETATPENWMLGADRAHLGAALVGLGRFAEAEPLLLDGFVGMNEREKQIPAAQKKRLAETRSELVQLYEEWGRPAEAAKWRAGH
jgi:tetratricopeptide (TPR) repeat protein